MLRCPLCHNEHTSLFYQDKKRSLFTCPQCQLIFSDAHSHLLPHVEKRRYQQNSEKYQKPLAQFLQSLIQECAQQNAQPLTGLNFGRIAKPDTLEAISIYGHKLSQYDPFFAPDHSLLKQEYDFISCYRVFEHFRFPSREWSLLCKLLKPGAWLAINTKILTEPENFTKWHHKNNPTHVSFYQRPTFEFLAQQAGFKLLFASNDLILVQKPSGSDIKRDQSSLINL
ncbi:methyltransferase domain-containing protein [Shewanella sp. UCD-KL12]|uniref:methyltransferase domain-containing protein n=1 Tax=Shewanella sp. UCD-KL12 TaxID=1917163 RepID=UPI000970B6B0|nr:methyltransferase domain-containing protein [Shewanella sp. UCD-KL12]